MKKFHTTVLAFASLTAAAAVYAVGTQTPALNNTQGGPKATFNGYTGQEIDTAVQHADKAYAAKDITGVQENLRHVVNCLVGPQGPGYDASMDDPCKRMGNGALNDVPADSDEHRLLSQALDEAKNGLNQHNVSDARSLAKQALSDLEDAKNDVEQ
ncbi:MAG TPA: hypothetical protein VGM16_03340 [Gammaproteobacteria bacterium]|jgi:hypothetical protein